MRLIARVGAFVMLTVACTVGFATPAQAWDRDGAADYAHDFWDEAPTWYPSYIDDGNDCANFVSQCLHNHRGKDFYDESSPAYSPNGIDWAWTPVSVEWGSSEEARTAQWLCVINSNGNWVHNWNAGGDALPAWTLADGLRVYFRDHPFYDDYRVWLGRWDFHDGGGPAPSKNESGIIKGTVVLIDYDWRNSDNDEGFIANHAMFCCHNDTTAVGPSGWSWGGTGDVVCAHTTARYHMAWTAAGYYNQEQRADWQYGAFKLTEDLN
jgi:hypothetical protein